jgi:hypothetical protein
MERQLVKSGNIKSVGYDPATRIMHVEFLSGGVYEHTDVLPDQYEAFCKAESLGKFYNQNFRSVKCQKVA